MKLQVLGSSSKGNAYILTADNGDIVLLECGVRFADVKKAINFQVSKIKFGLISHSHGDHSKYSKSFLDGGVKIFTSSDTIKATKISHHGWQHLMPKTTVHIGDWSIKGLDVKHDTQNFAYILQYKSNKILFITDCYFIPFKVPGVTNLIIEANFSNEIIDENGTPVFLHKRITTAHLSLDLCKDFIINSDRSVLNNIVLIHLSDTNSHADHFKKTIEAATGKVTHVASPGMSIDFDTRPF